MIKYKDLRCLSAFNKHNGGDAFIFTVFVTEFVEEWYTFNSYFSGELFIYNRSKWCWKSISFNPGIENEHAWF